MDALSRIYEALQIIYTFLPQEVFIIIITGLMYWLYEFLRRGNEENNKGQKD